MLRIFEALPPYFGGKRKLANRIMSYAEGETFIDAFLGGGSVSLLAKAKGYKVLCNDIAERSAIVGKALISNDDIAITEADIYRLFEPAESDNFIRGEFPQFYTKKVGEFLDSAWGNIRKFHDPVKQALMKLLFIKLTMYYRPYAGFGHPGAVEQMLSAKSEDELTATLLELKECYSVPVLDVVRSMAEQVNGGVFDNGHENQTCQQDVCEFLRGAEGDTVYIDPPYYGSQSYEENYRVLDCILSRENKPLQKSRFNDQSVLKSTVELFEAAKHIPRWIISIGQKTITKMAYIDIVKEYKSHVEDIPVKHRYTYGGTINEDTHWHEVLLVAA